MNSKIIVILLLYSLLLCLSEKPANIIIDGQFGDWDLVRRYDDPQDNIDGTVLQDFVPDCHNTTSIGRCDVPSHVYNPNVDMVEYSLAHNEDSIYAYMKVVGNIRNTSIGEGLDAGRTLLSVMLDLDDKLETGTCGNEGGYYPAECGFDMTIKIEIYNGSVNWISVVLHSIVNQSDLDLAKREILNNTVVFRSYAHYKPNLKWVYWDDSVPMTSEEEQRCFDGSYELPGTNHPMICFVKDMCNCSYKGVMDYAFSTDNHSVEFSVPFKVFLNNPDDKAALSLGNRITASFGLQTSNSYSLPPIWASDSSWPIRGYLVEPTVAVISSQTLWEDRIIAGVIGVIIGALLATTVALLATSVIRKGYEPVS